MNPELWKNRTGYGYWATEYQAPELLTGQPRTKAVDWWNLRILVFEMLSGIPPFWDDSVNEICRMIVRGALINYRPEISGSAKDFIARLLDRNPNTRLGGSPADVEEVKAHPFFAGIQWDAVLARKIRPEWIPNLKRIDEADGNGAGSETSSSDTTAGAGNASLARSTQC
jgi:serine/threonine protein kinase